MICANQFLTNLAKYVFGAFIKLVFEAIQLIKFGLECTKIAHFRITINILGFLYFINLNLHPPMLLRIEYWQIFVKLTAVISFPLLFVFGLFGLCKI